MFSFSDTFKRKLWLSVKERMKSNVEFETSMVLLQKLINLEVQNDSFRESDILEMQNYDVYAGDNLKTVCRLEAFFHKLFQLKGMSVNDISGKECDLIGYYQALGYDVSTMEGDVKASLPKESENYFYDYALAYELRKMIGMNVDGINEMSISKQLDYYVATWVVYLNQCFVNKQVIEAQLDRLVLKKIDFVAFAKQKKNEISEKELRCLTEYYVDLEWENGLNGDAPGEVVSVKFVGEAGAGKTTRMLKKYYDCLLDVIEGKEEVLPLWIELKKLNGTEKYAIEEEVKKCLGAYAGLYKELLSANKVALYLDGYNEVLMDAADEDGTKKKKLAMDIDAIHRDYPGLEINVTDRSEKANPPCMMKNVMVFKCKGISNDRIAEYCNKKKIEGLAETICNLRWISRINLTPGKLENLIELVMENRIPDGEHDFYEKYLEYILEREEVEKYETRISELRDFLSIFAEEITVATDGMKERELCDLWVENGIDRRGAKELLALAKQLPILEVGEDNLVKFINQFYYIYFSEL